MSTIKKGGKKNRKYGRNAADSLRYRNEDRRAKNKARRLRRHIKNFPNDKQSLRCY